MDLVSSNTLSPQPNLQPMQKQTTATMAISKKTGPKPDISNKAIASTINVMIASNPTGFVAECSTSLKVGLFTTVTSTSLSYSLRESVIPSYSYSYSIYYRSAVTPKAHPAMEAIANSTTGRMLGATRTQVIAKRKSHEIAAILDLANR